VTTLALIIHAHSQNPYYLSIKEEGAIANAVCDS
jgi:hypothetical protein